MAVKPIDIDIADDDPEDVMLKMRQCSDVDAIKALTSTRADNLKEAEANIKRAQAKQKQVYDQKHAKPSAFVAGEKVLVKDLTRKKRAGGKLLPHYTGP